LLIFTLPGPAAATTACPAAAITVATRTPTAAARAAVAAKAAGAPTINYGIFINTIIDFVIVAFAIYLMIQQVNRMKKKPAETPPATKDCPFCCSAIPIKAVRCPNCTSSLESN